MEYKSLIDLLHWIGLEDGYIMTSIDFDSRDI